MTSAIFKIGKSAYFYEKNHLILMKCGKQLAIWKPMTVT